MPTKARIKYLKNKQKEELHRKEAKRKSYLVNTMKEYNVNKEIELLEFLFKTFPNQSKNNVKNLLAKRFISVNGLCITQFNYVLYKGDTVQLSKEPLTKQVNIKIEQKVKNTRPQIEIIYEDDEFLVINKPSGLLSVESDKEKADTAYKFVLEYMQIKNGIHARCFQVHRIDKETSGVLLFTKDFELKENLKKNWNKLVSVRQYYALVDGVMPKKKDTIISYLKETDTHLMYDTHNEKDGLKSVTHYEVIKQNSKYSLLKVEIDSGRKNQIRVAMNDLGHPIVGDDKYGEPTNPIKRLGLHASKLVMTHPYNGRRLEFTAPIPSLLNKPFR